MKKADIVVTSLSEYIEKVTSLEGTVFYSRSTNLFPIYRGQANSEWDLNPSVYRNNRFKYEKMYPHYPSAPSSVFERLVLLSHGEFSALCGFPDSGRSRDA